MDSEPIPKHDMINDNNKPTIMYQTKCSLYVLIIYLEYKILPNHAGHQYTYYCLSWNPYKHQGSTISTCYRHWWYNILFSIIVYINVLHYRIDQHRNLCRWITEGLMYSQEIDWIEWGNIQENLGWTCSQKKQKLVKSYVSGNWHDMQILFTRQKHKTACLYPIQKALNCLFIEVCTVM